MTTPEAGYNMMIKAMHQVIRNVPYKSIGGRNLHLDLHLPDESIRRRGVVVYFHGGGLEVGARGDYEDTRASVLAAMGYTVATVEYRFIQEALLPAALEDGRDAVAWLKLNANLEYGVDASTIGAWGASAGGYLAALLALGNPLAGRIPAVDAAAVWFASFDLAAMDAASPMEEEVMGPSAVEGLLGEKFDRNNELHLSLNPVSMISANASAMLLVTGDRDRVIEPSQSVRMHDALVQAGVTSSLYIAGGAGHEDPVFDRPTFIAVVKAFFDEHLA